MSRINAIRLVNIKYDNNTRTISDEIFDINGRDTLFSMKNGGGKSVMIQLIMALFEHRRYMRIGERRFEDYFTGSAPSFIMAEWVLDYGQGYVLTGMMVRRRQDNPDENTDPLEMKNFIAEYKEPCKEDIRNIEIIKYKDDSRLLRGYGECAKLFDSLKKDSKNRFNYYDMAVDSQRRAYFERLAENDISSREWETIVHKVNETEGGLDKLFSECRDEKSLVSKWFIPTVENKIDGQEKIKNFEANFEKYIVRYRHDKDKMKNRDIIKSLIADSEIMTEAAEKFKEANDKFAENNGTIADFIYKLNESEIKIENDSAGINEKIKELETRITDLFRSKYSLDYYGILDKINKNAEEMALLRTEKQALEKERSEALKKVNLENCAKDLERLKETEGELALISAKLDAIKKKESEIAPKRMELGGKLRAYYEEKEKKLADTSLELTDSISLLKENITKIGEDLSEKEEEEDKLSREIVRLDYSTKNYSENEDEFNKRYKTNLARNILGEYEHGLEDVFIKQYTDEKSEGDRNLADERKNHENLVQNDKILSEKKEQLHKEGFRLGAELDIFNTRLSDFEDEIAKRRDILKYLDESDKIIFDTEKIISLFDKKAEDIENRKNDAESRLTELRKELEKLTSGRIMELPGDLADLFDDLGINYVYGLDWLRKGGFSEAERNAYVDKFPLLPYSVIISEADIKKLAESLRKVTTSFPIPIAVRESLTSDSEALGDTIINAGLMKMYVLFDRSLFDEEAIARKINEYNLKINKLEAEISLRAEEYRRTQERAAAIRLQKVTEADYNVCKNKIAEINTTIENNKEEVKKVTENIGENEKNISRSQRLIDELSDKINGLTDRIEAFKRLMAKYRVYLEELDKKSELTKESVKVSEKIAALKTQDKQLNEKLLTDKNELFQVNTDHENVKAEALKYASYDAKTIEGDDDIDKILADYTALISKINADEAELMDSFAAKKKQCDKENKELDRDLKRAELSRSDINISYDADEKEHQENIVRDRENEIRKKDFSITECDKKDTGLNTEKDGLLKLIYEKCGDSELAPKESLENMDYDYEITVSTSDRKRLLETDEKLAKRISLIKGVCSSLSEFADMPRDERYLFDGDIESFNEEELNKSRGNLVKDNNRYRELIRKAGSDLKEKIKELSEKKEYSADTFKRSFETIYATADNAENILKQIEIITASYRTQLLKLEADLEQVAEEKEQLVEQVLKYVREVNENIGMIGNNSTIEVHGRSVKMLKVDVPTWEEVVEREYKKKLSDTVDEITEQGLMILSENKPLSDFIGTRVNTKELYDNTLNISNVHVRLKKIEFESVVSITWNDVSKNSGGEGFVSSFMVISALMYYMRRNDNDIFRANGGSKVLIMDNPFAKTYSEHLLKPVFEAAKKSRVQLICFSGSDGEAIYDRFNNIYVLRLIPSDLHPGLQYVRSEHKKGDEEGANTVVSSQIEVDRQVSFF